MKTRLFLTAVAAGMVCASAIHAQAPAKLAGPWAKVPALPTACYQGDDPWGEKFSSVFNGIQQEHYRQNDINSELTQQLTDATSAEDPFAMAQRMTQAMLNDPQNAQKLLEMTQQSQQMTAEVLPKHEKKNQLEAESKTLLKKYKDEFARTQAPADAREAALGRKVTASGYASESGEGYPDWAIPEYHAILRDRDSAYAAHCAKWWAPSGLMHGFMKRYRDFLVLEHTPHLKQLDEQQLLQFEAHGVDASRWRSTVDYDTAEDYMKMAMDLFGWRETARRCRPLAENYQCQ